MKLSNRDFRPPRRSKYVIQPIKRRPTLRILLLAAAGILVYLKYDSIVSARVFRRFRHAAPAASNRDVTPASVIAPQALAASTLRRSSDSASWEGECRSRADWNCVEGWKEIGPAAQSEVRSVLRKARFQWGLDSLSGFTAWFRREGGASLDAAPFLQSLTLSLPKGTLTLTCTRAAGRENFCYLDRCLDDWRAHAPFARIHRPVAESRKEARCLPAEGAAFRPIARGRIVEIPDSSQGSREVKIYHGKNIFSSYRGFARLRPGLRAGMMVNADDTLGSVAAGGDSLGGLWVGIEKNGLRVDAPAFLGLDSSGASDAR